jgi:TRAP-type C4-dicarboxylate transport system substrate-binding protein
MGAEHRPMTRSALIAALGLAIALTGCGGSGETNKAGAPAKAGTRVLHIQSPDGGSPEAQHFAERVEARSRGALRVELLNDYPGGEPGNEAALARAVRAGQVDFGIVPARAWPAGGAPAFAAVQAPFVLGDYDVARRAIAGPAGAVLSDALEDAGVVPLGLVPAQLRRVLSVKPLVTKAAFRGRRIRINDNATSAADLRALGAQPIQGITNDSAVYGLNNLALDGIETAPLWAVSNKYWRGARRLTAYALFDAVYAFVGSRAAWERLSGSQQAAIKAAADDTARFSATLPDRDAASVEQLCRVGVRVSTPAPGQLAAIAAATEPVRAALRRDPATADVMRLLEQTDGAGPKLLPTPAACSADAPRDVEQPDDPAAIPNGIYVVTTTLEDHRRFGEYSSEWSIGARTWTTRLKDGKWERWVSGTPDEIGYVDGAGTYEVHGDEVTFHYEKPIVDASAPETLRWSHYNGRLTLQVVDVGDGGAKVIYTAHPWKRVR